MKFKKFAAILLSALILISGFLILFPYLSQIQEHSLLNSSPQSKGSYVLYEFQDGAVYNYINGTPTLLTQTGVLKIAFNRDGASMSLAIRSPPLKASLPTGETYHQLFERNETFNLTNTFLMNFINEISLSPGTVATIDGEPSIATTSHGISYSININGANTSVTRNARELGITLPSIVYFPDFIENNTSVNYPYPNYNQYDTSGGWNLLVSSHLAAGTTGINQFLEQLLNDTNVNLPVLEVTNFNLLLIDTNISLGPIYTMHYILEYLPLTAIAWAVGLAYILTVHRMAKNSQKRQKKVVKK